MEFIIKIPEGVFRTAKTPEQVAGEMIDGLLAATAIVHNLILITLNTRGVARTSVQLLNPFDAPSPDPWRCT
jgi:predicted nucleic acid-binding protein